MRAMVTGAAGQDGWFLAEALGELGAELVATGAPGTLDASHPANRVGSMVELDVTDRGRVEEFVREYRPEVIFHLAGLTSAGQSWQRPADFISINVLGTLNVLQAAHAVADAGGGSPQVINASSAEIFDSGAPLPYSEATPLRPCNPYGVSKVAAHLLVESYRSLGISGVNAILFNHESHLRPPDFVTGKIVRGVIRISRGEADSLTLGNLDSRRDWMHATDVVRALVLIAQQRLEGDFVISSGQSRSVADFVAAAFAAVGIADWQSYVVSDASLMRAADSPEQRGDSAKLAAMTGWRPLLAFEDWVADMVRQIAAEPA